jgi:chemotaxis protein methyltransferase CheR
MSVELTKRQYNVLRDLVYRECGINLRISKLALLKARLSKRMRSLRIESITAYMDLIKSDSNELINFIDAVSTNHTFFFRENRHCEFLIKKLDNYHYLKIWSAASSSGEEPFSIAFQLLEGGFRFEIFASDISTSMLSTAKRAIYHKDKLRLVPERIMKKYCLKGMNREEDYVKIKDEVRAHIRFARHNLISDPPPGLYDIIFCRNVMIYFDDATKQNVVAKLYKCLKDGGYLIIGASEGLVGLKHRFKYVEPSIYRK